MRCTLVLGLGGSRREDGRDEAEGCAVPRTLREVGEESPCELKFRASALGNTLGTKGVVEVGDAAELKVDSASGCSSVSSVALDAFLNLILFLKSRNLDPNK